MKKTLVSIIAAAMLAMGVGGGSSGCVTALERAKVNSAIEHRERSMNRDLEEIAKSVFCVRNEIEYRRDGAPDDEKPIKRTIYGTAMAYTSRAGFTYLVTNDHVANGSKKHASISITPAPGGTLVMTMASYTKVSDNLTLVDNKYDKDAKDDFRVSRVATDKDLDVAVMRTRKRLPVAASYIRNASMPVENWDDAYVIGFPRGLHKARAKGRITNSALRLPRDKIPYHALDITGTFGNSGSPYFFRKGDQLYWGGVIHALLPYRLSRSPLLGVPLKKFSHMLYRSYSHVVKSRGDIKKK